jgi:CRP-like cAMP-binding protein
VSDVAARGLLGKLSLFRGLQAGVLDRIASRVTRRSFPKNRLLFRAGEPSQGLWIVERGKVRLYRASRDGREQVLHEQGPGQSLAEVPLFDGGPYPANARAEEDSVLLFLSRDDFREICRSEPEVADAVIRELGGRLRRAVSLIEKISLRDVPSRVGLTLLEMARAGDRRGDEPFTLPMSQARLAERLATTRESVARALRTLQDEGLIEREGARIGIPDPAALEDRCYQG